MKTSSIQVEFRKQSDPTVAEHSTRFFKTGKGEYAENDKFLGIRVPKIRAFAKQKKDQATASILRLLKSEYHEERLLALFLMVSRFERGDQQEKSEIYRIYLGHTKYINNWDLVDSSAYQIVGAFLFDKDRRKLRLLSKSSNLWEQRMSVISTYYFIKRDQYEDTFAISKQLLSDKQDLIHKAVGWMLREVGNRNKEAEETFLIEHYQSMPRTMLRYAIEKFEKEERERYLSGKR